MHHVVLWQRVPSMHQSAFIRALAEQSGVRVTLVADESVGRRRAEIGWTLPDFGRAEWVRHADHRAVSVLSRTETGALHVFSGLRDPRLFQVFREVSGRNQAAALQVEAADHGQRGRWKEPREWWGVKGAIRRIGYWGLSLWCQRHLSFVLAMGTLGVEWFAGSGFRRLGLFPFGYSVEGEGALPERDVPTEKPFRLLYVGRLELRKGGRLLLEALRGLLELDWDCTFVGDGEDRQQLEALAAEYRLQGRVHFAGALPNRAATDAMTHSDLLVLPSFYDGWGAVVNEALARGVPVVCTMACGARDLIRSPLHGAVSAADAPSLAAALRGRILLGPPDVEERQRLSGWAACVSGSALAEYFLRIVEYVQGGAAGKRPLPPWMASESRGDFE